MADSAYIGGNTDCSVHLSEAKRRHVVRILTSTDKNLLSGPATLEAPEYFKIKKKMKTPEIAGGLLEDEIGKIRSSASTYKSVLEKPRICLVENALFTLRECWSIWRDAPGMRVCNRL